MAWPGAGLNDSDQLLKIERTIRREMGKESPTIPDSADRLY